MPNSDPAWVRTVQVGVVVNTVPYAPASATEKAAGSKGVYSGTSTNYQTVATWTVATGKLGELKEVLFVSSNYAKTVLQVTVGAVVWATAWSPQASMPLIFEDCRLAAGIIVLVEAKSSDGTAIIVDAIIVAKEIG